jgi:hypothetical protein
MEPPAGTTYGAPTTTRSLFFLVSTAFLSLLFLFRFFFRFLIFITPTGHPDRERSLQGLVFSSHFGRWRPPASPLLFKHEEL